MLGCAPAHARSRKYAVGDRTGISWTRSTGEDGTARPGATWNPISGCSKLSPECKHCYAERDWHRLTHLPAYHGRAFTDVALHEDRLDQPIRWNRPRLIFVCSMSDLFHEVVPDAFLDRIFAVMSVCPQHTFQILTKRAERMQRYLAAPGRREAIAKAAEGLEAKQPLDWVRADGCEAAERGGDPAEDRKWLPRWPLPNVWTGVTVGNQEAANERIPHLLNTPSVLRFLSCEPLIGPVDLRPWLMALDWVICGGESGPKGRPMHPAWYADLRDQCKDARRPFFFKQHGEWIPGNTANNDQMNDPRVRGGWVPLAGGYHDGNDANAFRPGDAHVLRVGRKQAGDRIDGRESKEMPC